MRLRADPNGIPAAKIFDVVIVGAGAAGLNAALVLGRARRDVLVLDSGDPRNVAALEMHGFISREGTSPVEFLEIGRRELAGYSTVAIAAGTASEITMHHGRFLVALDSGDSYRARRLLLATGMRDQLPDVAGINAFWGRSVFVCPYCDGWEVRDKRLVVYASLRNGVELAQELYRWSHDIVVCGHRSDSLTPAEHGWLGAAGVRLVRSPLHGLIGKDGKLEQVELEDGQRFDCDALFLCTALRQYSNLAERLGCRLRENGAIAVDDGNRTSVPECYAAGDAVTHLHQVVIAAASGVRAAISINNDLTAEDVEDLLRTARTGK